MNQIQMLRGQERLKLAPELHLAFDENEDELEVEAQGRDELVQELRTSAIAPCATHNRQVTQVKLEG